MMGRWALLSAGLHTVFIVVAVIGLLDYKTNILDVAQPLPVELVDHIEETAKSPDPLPESPSKEEPKEKPSPVELPKPAPVPESQSEDVAPPPPVETPKEKPVEKEPEPQAIEPPKVKPKPPKKPQPPKKLQDKPKPKPQNFDSMLKNLIPDAPKKPKGQGGELSDRLAASVLDRVRKQIEGVWRLPAGVKGMHEISIVVRISMNPDRTVRRVSLVNQSLLTNPTYQILAETALKAVNEFRYKPLLLPVNQYKVWKEITMEFDPRHIL